jgi:hypothetical protein
MEREFTYAKSFPFLEYGIDLHAIAEMEKGVKAY